MYVGSFNSQCQNWYWHPFNMLPQDRSRAGCQLTCRHAVSHIYWQLGLQYEPGVVVIPWWRHQMETFSASPCSLDLCAGNSQVTGEFPSLRPVTRSFDIFFDLRLNKWWSEQSWGWWFKTPSHSLWRHCNDELYRHWWHNRLSFPQPALSPVRTKLAL